MGPLKAKVFEANLSVLSHQPSRRLNTPWNHHQKKSRWDHLHRNRNHPASTFYLISKCITHTGTPNRSKMNDELGIPSKKATKGSWWDLGLVCWDHWFHNTNRQVSQHSSNAELYPGLWSKLDYYLLTWVFLRWGTWAHRWLLLAGCHTWHRSSSWSRIVPPRARKSHSRQVCQSSSLI